MLELDLMSLMAIHQRVLYTLWQTSQNVKIPILLQWLKHLLFMHLQAADLHEPD
jgi:hypothetical protein